MMLSEWLQNVISRLVKNDIHRGLISYGQRLVGQVEFDQEKCEELLQDMVIHKDNVIIYLEKKYIPTRIDNGVVFHNQKCIQKCMIASDGSLTIFIKNSEPHKIVTDTIHVRNILSSMGYEFNNNIKYIIENLQLDYQDLLICVPCLEKWQKPVSSTLKQKVKEILAKHPRLEDIARIKKRSIKRKYLRHYVFQGYIVWKELRMIINIRDFSDSNVEAVCYVIKQNSKTRRGEDMPI